MEKPAAIRATERYPLNVAVEVAHPRTVRRFEAELRDLSIGGCRLVSEEPFSVGDQLLLSIDGFETWPGVVAWSGVGCVGIAFHISLDQSIPEHCARGPR